MATEEDGPPQGVIVCVRLRPMFTVRPDGTPGREAACKRVVEMEGKSEKGVGSAVTRIFDPNDMSAKPREYAFDRSYWSHDGFIEDPERPGVHIPDGPDSKYVSQDMVWSDVGQIIMKNALGGYNCTLFAYGQSGAGKSYSVVGYPPNIGIIPKTLQSLFAVVDGNSDQNIRYNVEIAMLEVYMDEVYDLLEPKKKEREKLNVFVNRGEVFVYDPKDRKNMNKIWRAAKDLDHAESFRSLGDANRSVRATGMNPSSSRGHTIFMVRFRKEAQTGGAWVEQMRSKISLVDLAGSERAHDTGLTGVGLEEGIAINQSLTALGQVLVSICKGERVNYRDKLTSLLAESLNGNAVTVMIAALSPADINYNDTVSTLRFADNAKKMPVKVKKQLDPTAQLIEDLKAENERLQAQLAALGGGEKADAMLQEKEEYEQKLQEAEDKLAAMEESYKAMESQAKVQQGGKLRIAAIPLRVEDKAKLQELDAEIQRLREELAEAQSDNAPSSITQEELEAKLKEREEMEAQAIAAAEEVQKELKQELADKAKEMETMKLQSQKKSADIENQVAQISSALQQLSAQGQEAKDERAQLAALLQEKGDAEDQRRRAQQEEKAAIESLLDVKLREIEQLVTMRDEAKAALAAAQGEGDPASIEEKQGEVSAVEQALAEAREEYESMEDKASDVGAVLRFRAALLAQKQQESQSKAALLENEVQQLQSNEASEEELSERLRAAQEAQQEAKQAAEEARQAAEAALAERMAELQEMTRQRDEALAEAMDARARASSGEEGLLDRRDAIQAIIDSEQESWEDRLAKAEECEKNLRESFEDMGLSVPEIMAAFMGETAGNAGPAVLPHFVNLDEDAHDDGLIYLIPEGKSEVKKYGAVGSDRGIRLDGESIRAQHCALCYDANGGSEDHSAVTIAAADEAAVTWVNGERLTFEPVELRHGARVILGNDFVFRFVDPRAKGKKKAVEPGDRPGTAKVIDWQFAMDELSRKNGIDIDSQLNAVRSQYQDQLAKREAEFAEEQKILEERMQKERDQFQRDLRQLKQQGEAGSEEPGAAMTVADSVKRREAAQERTEAALQGFKNKIAIQRSRAQWVRAAFLSAKDERFELDVRLAKQQMRKLQPRIVEANRISAVHNRKVQYGFHLLDVVDPRPREMSSGGGGAATAVAAGVAGGVLGGTVGFLAGGVGAAPAALAGATAAATAASAYCGNAVAEAVISAGDDEALKPRRVLLQVKVERTDVQEAQFWPQQKFLDRFVLMCSFANGESLDTFYDKEDSRYEDIFWDQMDHVLLGTGAIGLTPLLAHKAVRETVTLRNHAGDVRGALSLSMSVKGQRAKSASTATEGGTTARIEMLRGQSMKGEVRFDRLTNIATSWSGVFIRFSWFTTHGRLEKESPVVEGANVGHVFTFEQQCTDAFLDYLQDGIMTIQVRAFERGNAKDTELRELRMRLRKTEAELAVFRDQVGQGGFEGALEKEKGEEASPEDRLRARLADAQKENAEMKRENEVLKRELALAQQQQHRRRSNPNLGIEGWMPESKVLRERVEELSSQLQQTTQAQPSEPNLRRRNSAACSVM